MGSLEELYAIKFKRIQYDTKYGYSEMMELIQPTYNSLSRHMNELIELQKSLSNELPRILHGVISLDPKKDGDIIKRMFENVERGIAWSCHAFEIWKGQLDILWELYQWRQQKNDSDGAIVTISTWFQEDSVFNDVIKKVVGNNAMTELVV